MADQQPPESDGDTSPPKSDPGHKKQAKRVELDTGLTMVLADYGQRFRARIVDAFVFGGGLVAALIAASFVLPEYSPVNMKIDLLDNSDECGLGIPITARVVMADALFFLPFLYEIATIAWRERTLGMKVVGIRVVSVNSGRGPSLLRAILRGGFSVCLFPVFYGLTIPVFLGIGCDPLALGLFVAVFWWLLVHLSVVWGEDRRGWHDLISGTIVVTTDPPCPAATPGADAA